MHLLVQLGNKVPLAYFYSTLFLLLWHYSQNQDERSKLLLALNNLLYLFFSALTVFWFVPIWWGIVEPIFASESIQGTEFQDTILIYMSIYLFITVLPTLLAIAFIWKKWRWSVFWTVMVLIWTSPFASLLLRKIWWEVKVIRQSESVQGMVFESNFFKHIDGYLLLALGINTILLLVFYFVPWLRNKTSVPL